MNIYTVQGTPSNLNPFMLNFPCKFMNASYIYWEKNCFSAWASTLNMGLINKVDMVCLSPVGYGV